MDGFSSEVLANAIVIVPSLLGSAGLLGWMVKGWMARTISDLDKKQDINVCEIIEENRKVDFSRLLSNFDTVAKDTREDRIRISAEKEIEVRDINRRLDELARKIEDLPRRFCEESQNGKG